MRLRWLAAVCVSVLLAQVTSYNLIAQDDTRDGAIPPVSLPGQLNAGALRMWPTPKGAMQQAGQRLATRQEAARTRALDMRQRSGAAARVSSNVATPGFGGFAAGKFVAGGSMEDAIAIVNGDFNGDGKPDVAVLDYLFDTELFLNDGNGNFTMQFNPFGNLQAIGTLDLAGSRVLDAAAADLNGDGFTDLILTIEPPFGVTNSLLILLNQKDGTFGSASLITPPALDAWFYLAVAKGASGSMDIVVAQYHFPTQTTSADGVLLQTFHNSGAGSFTPGIVQTLMLPASQLPFSLYQIALADVNNDGKQDVLLGIDTYSDTSTQHVESIDVLQGNGDGTFQQMNANSTVALSGVPAYLNGFVVQSLTIDESRKDLITYGSEGVFAALSNGDGTYKTPVQVSSEIDVFQAQAADMNGDGKADLILSNYSGEEVLLGNGDGTFGGIASANYAFFNLNGTSDHETVIADFNGDGKPDFANVDYQGDIQVGFGNGDGTFIATPILYPATSFAMLPSEFTVESDPDLNGDGLPDLLAFGYQDGSMLSAVTNATGGFTFHVALPISAYSQLAYIMPIEADFNGDGKQDAVMSGFDGSVAVALSNGDGTLNQNVTLITFTPALQCPILQEAIAGDINGDGKMDIVVAYGGDKSCGSSGGTPSGYFTVLGNGDGTFMTPAFHAVGTEVTAIALGRFHGADQPLDLAVANYTESTEEVDIYMGDGAANFAAGSIVISVPLNGLVFPIYQILTDDFNSDGNPDITLVGGPYYGGPELFAGNGDGTFGEVQYVDQLTNQTSAVYTDLNGDGIPDLIGSDTSTDLSVNLGIGNGAFAAPIHYFFAVAGLPSETIFAGRFLGDNTQSIIGWGGETAFFMNQGGTSLAVTPSAASVAPAQSVTLTATLTPTLTGQPTPTGTVTFFDGTTQLGSEAVGTPLSTSSLALGAHSITAKYSGDGHFNPNTSAAVSVTVAAPPAPDFSLTSSAGSLTVAKGGSGTLGLTVAANASLSASVTFACAGLPSEATCAFSPASLNVTAGTSGTSTLTIATRAASSDLRKRADGRPVLPGLGAAAMAGLMCFLLPRRRGRWLALVVALGLAALAGLSGCGGGGAPTGPTDPGTPTGMTNVTLTATAVSGSTTVSHTMTVALTVQ